MGRPLRGIWTLWTRISARTRQCPEGSRNPSSPRAPLGGRRSRGPSHSSAERSGGESSSHTEVAAFTSDERPGTTPQSALTRLSSRFREGLVFCRSNGNTIDPVSFAHRDWARRRLLLPCCYQTMPKHARSIPHGVSPKCRDLRASHRHGPRWECSEDYS